MSVVTLYTDADRERVRHAKASKVPVSSLRPEVKALGWDVRWRQHASFGETSFRMLAVQGWRRDDADALDRLVADVKAANGKRAPREAVLALFLEAYRLPAESDKPTLHTFAFDTFVPYVRAELKPGAQLSYLADIERRIVQEIEYVRDTEGKFVLDENRRRVCVFQISALGEMAIDRITRADVTTWYNETAKRWRGRTRTKALETLSSMLSYAVELGLIESNPALGVGPHSKRRKRGRRARVGAVKPNRVVDPEAVELVRRYFILRRRFRDALFVALMAYLGLRPQEVVVLRWKNLVDETGRAVTDLQIDHSQSGGVELDETKTGDWRYIKVFEPVREMIEHCYREMGSPDRASYVCLTPQGTPVISKRWSKTLGLAWKQLGLPHHRPYDFRHSAASYLGSGGDDETGRPWTFVEIGLQLGHDAVTCGLIYQHVVRFKKYRGLTIEQLISRASAVAEERLVGLGKKGDPIFDGANHADDEPAARAE